LIRELDLYLAIFGERPLIRELHLGGGTPTFFSPLNLSSMMNSIRDRCDFHENAELSFEGHPNNTSFEHLDSLHKEGFNRVSFGIQDLNERVQVAINRIQPYENVERVTDWARDIGYSSVNFDFVYGLPFQHSKNLAMTLQTALKLMPERIAFYSYAHMPWTSGGQRAYDENDLPSTLEKANMYLMGRQIFLNRQYMDIGMDHFALQHDSLADAVRENNLHRNFMGYTVAPSAFLLGLGTSSISDAVSAYNQNEKSVEKYLNRVNKNELPLTKGHFLSVQEQAARQRILKIACERKLSWDVLSPEQEIHLTELENDGIIKLTNNSLHVTDTGLLFLRNVCAVFDPTMTGNSPKNTYSKAI
jgi:oxygen-independent coproporphyrinogen-3 oxidase